MPPAPLSIYRLPFRIGDFRLFTVALKLQQLAAPEHSKGHFQEFWPGDITEEAQGALVRSLPTPMLLPTLSSNGRWLRYVVDRYHHHYVDMTGRFEEYIKGFSSKTRNTLKRKLRKFERESGGTIDLRCYRSATELAEFHRLAMPLSNKTYQARRFDAGLPTGPNFLSELQRRGNEGSARAYLLYLKGEAVSYLYTPLAGDTAIYAYLGFDLDHAALSPGTVLQYLAFQEQFADPSIRLFDFTEGDGAHKEFWSNKSVPSSTVLYLRSSAKLYALVTAHKAQDKFNASVGRLLDRVGLKHRLKKWLRR